MVVGGHGPSGGGHFGGNPMSNHGPPGGYGGHDMGGMPRQGSYRYAILNRYLIHDNLAQRGKCSEKICHYDNLNLFY